MLRTKNRFTSLTSSVQAQRTPVAAGSELNDRVGNDNCTEAVILASGLVRLPPPSVTAWHLEARKTRIPLAAVANGPVPASSVVLNTADEISLPTSHYPRPPLCDVTE